jgi:hypothetical protein
MYFLCISASYGRCELVRTLKTIADYARASLTDQDVSQRFIAYYGTYIEENKADFEALELESSALFTALEAAHHLENHTAFVQGVFALTDFLLGRGLYDLGKTYLQQAYEAIIALGDTCQGRCNNGSSNLLVKLSENFH